MSAHESDPAAPPRCPACAGPLLAWRSASSSDPQLARQRSFELGRCPDCGTATTLDAPEGEAVAELYEGGTYGPVRSILEPLVAPLRRLMDRDKLRFFAGLPPGARIVEIGAGDGALLSELAAAGHAVDGVEPSGIAVARARERGIEITHAGLEQARFEPGSCDAVVFWHVLEHLRDPAAALAGARQWLAPGGRLIVAVPNLSGLQARIGGDRWFHQDVPRHRTHFTSTGLSRLYGRTGFEPPALSHLLLEQNPLGMWQTLLNRLTFSRDFFFRALKRDLEPASRTRTAWDAAVTLLLGPPLISVALLLEGIAGLAGRGGSVVAIGAVATHRASIP